MVFFKVCHKMIHFIGLAEMHNALHCHANRQHYLRHEHCVDKQLNHHNLVAIRINKAEAVSQGWG